MRKILFRGKRVDNGEWVEGYLIQKGGETLIVRYPYCTGKVHETSWSEFCFGGFIEVIPETVGQYTGLTDKNGKKIFEGDIVKQKGFLNNYYSSVGYAAGRFLVRDYETLLPTALGGISRYEIEVIGNIHDNPKLLNNFKN